MAITKALAILLATQVPLFAFDERKFAPVRQQEVRIQENKVHFQQPAYQHLEQRFRSEDIAKQLRANLRNQSLPMQVQPESITIKPKEINVPVVKPRYEGKPSQIKGIVKTVVSAVKAAYKAIVEVKNILTGNLFGILSSDIFRRQEPIRFDPGIDKPAVISINGMLCTRSDGAKMAGLVKQAFGVESIGIIRNDTGFFSLLSDALQILGHEVLGARDKPVKSAITAMKQGIQEKGSVYVIAHSQGTAIFALALRGLTKEERSKVHYYGAGSQWFVDAKRAGLASARNVSNSGDPIPKVGNTYNPTNFLNPTHLSRVNGNWDRITVRAIGNEHSFSSFYAKDMAEWAKEMTGGVK